MLAPATPLMHFTCGVCGTKITDIATLAFMREVMEKHAAQCKGYPAAVATDTPAAPVVPATETEDK